MQMSDDRAVQLPEKHVIAKSVPGNFGTCRSGECQVGLVGGPHRDHTHGRGQVQAVAKIYDRTYHHPFFDESLPLAEVPEILQSASRIRFPEVHTRTKPVVVVTAGFEGLVP